MVAQVIRGRRLEASSLRTDCQVLGARIGLIGRGSAPQAEELPLPQYGYALSPLRASFWSPFQSKQRIERVNEYEDHGTATWKYWQEVRNALRARPSYRNRPPVAVRARVVWTRDGTEVVVATAIRLGFDGAIFVELRDRRCSTLGVWLHPDAVWWDGKPTT